ERPLRPLRSPGPVDNNRHVAPVPMRGKMVGAVMELRYVLCMGMGEVHTRLRHNTRDGLFFPPIRLCPRVKPVALLLLIALSHTTFWHGVSAPFVFIAPALKRAR